ncbi:MAG TPA: TrkA family potassium uptake protein [Micromonosporaceae bacterium]|nr:TrkA family potassium uptake protein [Micromonosporaceae bacterium]
MWARQGRKPGPSRDVAVIGLGRFGVQVARSLEQLGHEVLAIDEDRAVVQRWAEQLTYVVQADATDNTALQQLGVAEFSRVVVGIGSDVEASVLAVLTLTELGVSEIWATASSPKHATILSTIGARHVVYPEAAMGDRVAHLITSKMIDFIEFDGFAIAQTRVPAEVAGRSLGESGLGSRYGIQVIGVKRPGEAFEYADPATVIPADGVLIVAGTADQVQRFAATT